MKLRIKGNSLRLRVTRSELEAFQKDRRIEETTRLGPEEQSYLTYVLEQDERLQSPAIHFNPPMLSVILPVNKVDRWVSSDQVGIYATLDLGPRGTLNLTVEKDFACLHGTAEENSDAFPNPNLGITPPSAA